MPSSTWKRYFMLPLALVCFAFFPNDAEAQSIQNISNEVVIDGRHNNRSWFAPSAAFVPGDDRKPVQVFVTAINLMGRDLGTQHFVRTDDLGQSWSSVILPRNWQKIPHEQQLIEVAGA